MDWADITDKVYCNSETYPNSGVPKIPFYVSNCIEIISLGVILFFLKWRRDFWKLHKFNNFWDFVTLFLTVIATIDILIAMFWYWSMYVAVLIWPLLLITTLQQIWWTFRIIFKVVWLSKEILLLYISYILLFGWIGYWLFWGSIEGASDCPDLGTCCWNLLI